MLFVYFLIISIIITLIIVITIIIIMSSAISGCSVLYHIYIYFCISGAWLAPLQVNRVHDFRFDTEYRSRGCNNQHIISHKQSIDEMHQKHRQLRETGKLCVEEIHLRNSFIYNWAAPPTECCKRVGGIP